MKIKRIASALILSFVLAAGVCVFAACDDGAQDKVLTVLPAPANVAINYGEDPYDSKDDTVTFAAVEHASSYNVYVYAEGATTAKVTMSTSTTVELATPLDAGAYKVSVIAVGDAIDYKNSNGSAPVDYKVDELVTEKLETVSAISMDFSKVDAANAQYPTISFKGVDNASRYMVYLYASDADGTKKDAAKFDTSFSVPYGSETKYMMDSANYADLAPGYYVADVTAIGDGEFFTDGDTVTSDVLLWGGITPATPAIAADGEAGIIVELTNTDDFANYTDITVTIYADAACSQKVASKVLNYYTKAGSMPWDSDVVNNKVGFTVLAEATGDNPLVAGTYYVKAQVVGDGVIYHDSGASTVVTVTADVGEGKVETGGGGQGGGQGGGPGGGDMKISFGAAPSFAAGAATIAVPISVAGNSISLGGAPAAAPTAGSTYSYVLTGSGPMGEAITGTLELKSDNSVVCTVNGFGPFAATTQNGTFAAAGGTLTVTWAA